MVDKSNEVHEVTPAMQEAWMDYDPVFPPEMGMTPARVSGAIRHSFFAGYKAAQAANPTPAARWRERGELDPHGNVYDYERAMLCGGHLTDDEVAHQTAMLMRYDLNHEAVLQTAKDRIRWLSRSLERAQRMRGPLRPRPRDFYGPDDWKGGDPEEQAAIVRGRQEEWDREFARLSWFRRTVYHLFRV